MTGYDKTIWQLVNVFNRAYEPKSPLDVNKACGGYRVTTNQGSRDISPRLPGREMVEWLGGFAEGYIFRDLQEP